MRRRAHVDALLARLPADEPDWAALQSRATAYSQDCGCTMGAAFLAGSLPLALAYVTLTDGLSVRRGIAGVVFVLVAALSGKASGLVLASLKLALLRRSISRRLRAEECFEHVHVH
jgi:VIT1/CCC1 family predicted Fe2+/Mn2+ transporter